jgi:Uma2 family endonuclease
LLIEVADSSLAFDLGEKFQLYGQAGIRDYWVVDISGRTVHVFREPEAGGYQVHQCHSGQKTIAPLALETALLTPAELFACLDE